MTWKPEEIIDKDGYVRLDLLAIDNKIDWSPDVSCCEMMKVESERVCPTCRPPSRCPDKIMTVRDGPTGGHEYGIPIHDGGGSYITIDYCPWCGAKL
jgi:hypothetical protein